MFNRWFLSGTALATIGALVLVIHLDSRDRAPKPPSDTAIVHPGSAASSGSAGNDDYRTPPNPERISWITSVLDTLRDERTRLPYYGEMIRLYSESEYPEQAGKWAEKRAKSTDTSEDWEIAGSLYFEAVRRGGDEDTVQEYARKAETAYQNALSRRPDDAELLTDLAVIYMSRLKPEASWEILKRVLQNDPDHLRANFNTGVLLHQMGSTEESIPFFDRALVLAKNSEWKPVVQGYLDRHHHEIYN